MRRSSLDDLCDVDAVVSRNMLVPHTTSNAEAQTWTRESGQASYKYWNCSGCCAGTNRRIHGAFSPGPPDRAWNMLILPLGPLISLIWMMRSLGGRRRRTYSLTTGPASFSASTAMEWVTSRTSTSLTNIMLSFTLETETRERYDLRLRPTSLGLTWTNLSRPS